MALSVLFDGRLVLEKPTGIGQYVTSLLTELLQQAPDWQFHFLRRRNPWPGYRLAELNAPNLVQHPSDLGHMSLRQYLVIPRLARELGVDLIHHPHFDAPALFGATPVVATIHDAKYLVRPDFFTNLSMLKRLMMRLSFALTLRWATAVIADSQATADDLRRLFPVPDGRLHVIHAAADSSFRPAPAEAVRALRDKFGLQRPFILSVGERRPHKNQAGLIRAFARSRSRATHDLVIVGQAYRDYTKPEETAVALGLSDRVHFLAGVSFDDLIAAYTAADLFALVSFYEGFGLPLLEAMACGAPVIAANTTATAEIAGDGGLLVDPADPAAIAGAIDAVLADPARRGALITRGAARQAQFTWTKTAVQTLAVYQQSTTNH